MNESYKPYLVEQAELAEKVLASVGEYGEVKHCVLLQIIDRLIYGVKMVFPKEASK